jgi:hypothetical protein
MTREIVVLGDGDSFGVEEVDVDTIDAVLPRAKRRATMIVTAAGGACRVTFTYDTLG